MENTNGGVDKINDEQKRDDSQHADQAEKHAAQPAVFIGKDIPVLLVFALKLPHVLLTGGVQGFGIIVLHGKQQLHHVGIQQLAVFALQLL